MTDMEMFVAISAALTGIPGDTLAPGIDPIDIKQAYFAQASADPAWPQLLQAFQAVQTQPPDVIADTLLNKSGDPVRYLSRAIMLAWYLGSWYAPAALQTQSAFAPFKVVSSAAYTQGWSWRVAQAHPMGYSEWNFGYWSSPPPSLSDFLGS